MCAGDIIVPKAEKRVIPVQFDEFTKPEISTYSLESTIAEKVDAMLQRLEMTSRMKDFYDIYCLSNMFDFDGRELQEAIFETLQNRGTSYSRDSLNQIAELANDTEMISKWNYFLRTIKVNELDFGEVIDAMVSFLYPVWQAILDEDELLKKWDKEKSEWA